MLGKRLLAPALVLLVLATGLAGLGAWPASQPQPEAQGIRVELYIYKNGELVYHDPDDPATVNFLKILEALLDNDNDADDDIVMTGTTVDFEATTNGIAYVGRAIIAVSNDTVAFSRTLSNLANMQMGWASAEIQNNTELLVSGTITMNTSMNITYVALLMHFYDSDTALDQNIAYNAIIFADPLAQPLQVQAGDVVTVVYKIVAP